MSECARADITRHLVEHGTNQVRFDSLQMTHEVLLQNRFRLVRRKLTHPGYHLFSVCDDILVRIKTHGDFGGPRNDQAHLSIALWSETLEYGDEWGKSDSRGRVLATPRRTGLPPALDKLGREF